MSIQTENVVTQLYVEALGSGTKKINCDSLYIINGERFIKFTWNLESTRYTAGKKAVQYRSSATCGKVCKFVTVT